MDISIVIVGWNAKHYLELCLKSLYDAPPRRGMEVLVVDNASSDGSSGMIKAQFPAVKVIRSEENLGFAKGNNVAIRQCQGRYIALVNPDVIVFPGCLDALADFLDENPRVGNVGPRVLNPDMSQQSTCRRFPNLWNNLCSATGLATAFKNSRVFAGEHMWFFPHDRTRQVDVLVGCFSMIRHETFDEVGLLDEDLFMYGDDVDWCRRAWKTGWQVVFFPGARAIHYGGKITASYPVRFAVAQQRSVLHYWRKHHGFWGVWGIKSIMLFHHLVRYGFGVLRGVVLQKGQTEDETRRQVSAACLRAIFSERIAHKALAANPSSRTSISNSISRFNVYLRRNGALATVRRGSIALKRALFSSRMIVFYYDLPAQGSPTSNLPSSISVERKTNQSELSRQDLDEITNFWNPTLAGREIRDRFQQGASLWLIKRGGQLAGYSWTIRGRSIADYYFPMAHDDVQLFDFYTFPRFRGRAILWFLVNHILHSLAIEGAGRVFGDVAEWNEASLAFYKITPFRRLGVVRKYTLLGRTFVRWTKEEPVEQKKSLRRSSSPDNASKRPGRPSLENVS
jgi:GT2 family glycosyltransferase/ribosomal protein S18 acetylase RimI-like enzyme